jgi:hypothetical protein
MLWGDEQRGIGELMSERPSDASFIIRGHAAFHRDYDKVFAPWMERFAQDLFSPAAATSNRLRLLHWALYGLVQRIVSSYRGSACRGQARGAALSCRPRAAPAGAGCWLAQGPPRDRVGHQPHEPRTPKPTRNHRAHAVLRRADVRPCPIGTFVD